MFLLYRAVIERLHAKLKKAIHRKINKNGSSGVTLLHKGLPSNALN